MTTTACFAARQGRTAEEIQLAMQRLWLTGRVLPVGARLTVGDILLGGKRYAARNGALALHAHRVRGRPQSTLPPWFSALRPRRRGGW